MGADFQDAFYAVFALPIATLLAFLLAGSISLGLLRFVLSAFSLLGPRRRRSSDKL